MAKPPTSSAPPANGFVASLARELAYAVEDIRHKVIEEGWFGRQVTPSTFPREDPPLTPPSGIHGEPAMPSPSGPDIHGKGGPVAQRGIEGQVLGPEGPPPRDALPSVRPAMRDVEPADWANPEAARLEFLDACRALANGPPPDDPGPDRSHQIAGPDR